MRKPLRWTSVVVVLSVLVTGAILRVARSEDHGAKTPTEGCWVVFYEDDDYKGGQIKFNGPHNEPNMNLYKLDNTNDAGDNADSLVTGPKAWLEVFEDENYKDTRRQFGPNSRIGKLDDHDIGDNIDSFRLYDSKPPHWKD